MWLALIRKIVAWFKVNRLDKPKFDLLPDMLCFYVPEIMSAREDLGDDLIEEWPTLALLIDEAECEWEYVSWHVIAITKKGWQP